MFQRGDDETDSEDNVSKPSRNLICS